MKALSRGPGSVNTYCHCHGYHRCCCHSVEAACLLCSGPPRAAQCCERPVGTQWLDLPPPLTFLPHLPGGAVTKDPLGPSPAGTLQCPLCGQARSPSEGTGPDSATSGRDRPSVSSPSSLGCGFGAPWGGVAGVAACPVWDEQTG